MDVYKSNYLLLLPSIIQNIQNCDFYSIDTELSGLNKSNLDINKIIINNQTIHETLFIQKMMDYKIIQFGLALFNLQKQDQLE